MKRLLNAVLLTGMAAGLVSCQQETDTGAQQASAPEPAPEAVAPEEAPEAAAPEATTEPDTGPDSTVADPDHYSVALENERVRILRIAYGPGEESVMHYHPDSVPVFLTNAHVSFELPDGSVEESESTAGQATLAPAGQHLPRNLSEEPVVVVLVELKDATESEPAEAAEAPGVDPTEVDPAHYTTEHESDRLRILRISYGPGEESVMHFHPDSVAVFLTPQHVSMGLADGSSSEVHAEAGDAIFIPASQHLPKNLTDEPFELILVELKG